MLGLPTEDDSLRKLQEVEDHTRFGQRSVPADVVEVQSDNEVPSAPQTPGMDQIVDGEPPEPSQALSMQNLVLLHERGIEQPEQVAHTQQVKLSTIDWNSGHSGLAAWLNSSALPSNDSSMEGSSDPLQVEMEQMLREHKDIEALKRVHLTSAVPETEPLRDKLQDYQHMPLDVQVHVRKIVDRFPQLPAYLAKRFASSNAARRKRLQKDPSNRDSESEV